MGLVDFSTGLQGALLQRMLLQREAQKYADAQRQQGFQNSMASRRESALEDQNAYSQKRQAGLDADAMKQRTYAEANTLGDQIAPQTVLDEKDPAVETMQQGGRGSLLTKQESRPEVTTGPLLPGDTGAARKGGFLKTASQKQLVDTQKADEQDWKTGIAQQLADLKASTPAKEPTGSYQLQPEIDPKTGQQTGRFLGFNTHTNSWEPVKGQGPGATKAGPGAAQAANEQRTTHEALDTLGQLDQAIENARSLVGPGSGQISSLEQMAGNADPRIQALGVKMKAAKMRVDHAITGSVRAGASPQLLSQWDNILANKITPEGLKAGVQAMREILGGGQLSSGGGAVSMVAPDGRRLSVPADKVAELEAHGAKRAQ